MANKADLINYVAEEHNLKNGEATKYVQSTLDGIMQLVADEGKLSLINFGNFEKRERKARKGRNPQTQEEILIPAKVVPAFSPSKMFKEIV